MIDHLGFRVRDLAAARPGPRGQPELNYYAGFVLDPDGNNIEAGFRG